VRIGNEGRSPVEVHVCNAAPTPAGFAQIVSGDFPVFHFIFHWRRVTSRTKVNVMKDCTKILFSILVAAVCTASFAADKPNCSKTGKNCPMNDNKECNCGKSCSC
jgi:hypothetical protein